jgi:hypothetical protein
MLGLLLGWIRLHFKQGAELLRITWGENALQKITDDNKFRRYSFRTNEYQDHKKKKKRYLNPQNVLYVQPAGIE